MHQLFEPGIADELITRLSRLTPASKPLWGKMNASQMVKHCQAGFDVFFGELKLKRGLIGILFGGMAKKQLFSDKPFKKNLPTAKEFIVSGQPEFEKERDHLVQLIRQFVKEGPLAPDMMHPFFGKMTAGEWALLGYKHLDHHLQQFGL